MNSRKEMAWFHAASQGLLIDLNVFSDKLVFLEMCIFGKGVGSIEDLRESMFGAGGRLSVARMRAVLRWFPAAIT
jgi:hypothetical protein